MSRPSRIVPEVVCTCGKVLEIPASHRAHLAAREAAARAEALREAADGLYLNRPGQHNEGAKDWLHRRANLIDPRTRGSVCEHGYSRSVECGFCEDAAARIARTDGAGS